MSNAPDKFNKETNSDVSPVSEDKLLGFKIARAQRDDMRKLQEADKRAIDKALAPHRLMQSLLITLFISSIPLIILRWQYLGNRDVDTPLFLIFTVLFLFISFINLKLATPYIIILLRNVARRQSPVERLMWLLMALLSIAVTTIVWTLPMAIISSGPVPPF